MDSKKKYVWIYATRQKFTSFGLPRSFSSKTKCQLLILPHLPTSQDPNSSGKVLAFDWKNSRLTVVGEISCEKTRGKDGGAKTSGTTGRRGAKLNGALFVTIHISKKVRPQEMATSTCPTRGVNNAQSGTAHLPRTRTDVPHTRSHYCIFSHDQGGCEARAICVIKKTIVVIVIRIHHLRE